MRRRLLCLSAVLAMLPLVPVRAQQAAIWRDSTARLQQAFTALRDSLVGGDSSLVEIAREGSFVLRAAPDDRRRSLEVFEEFTQSRRHWFGDEMPSTGGFRISFAVATTLRLGMGREHDVNPAMIVGLPDTGRSARLGRVLPAAEVMDQYAGQMLQNGPPAFMRWLGFTPSFTMPEQERRRLTMYGLVTSSGTIQRGCLDGDLSMCAEAFGLRPITVANAGPFLPLFLRSDLFLFALERGGPGAWGRMRAAPDTGMGAALSAAMGLPLDSVLARWRGELLQIRPAETPWSGRHAVLALAWVAISVLMMLGAARWG